VREKSWGLSKAHGPNLTMAGGSADQEVEIAWKNFFNGTTNGLMLELGAMDGKSYSASAPFEEEAGWKAILIEASSAAADILMNRPNALSFQLAVCQKETTVHFVNAGDLGGILEFMTPLFVMKFHSYLVSNETIALSMESTSLDNILDWKKVEAAGNVAKVKCIPLQAILDELGIYLINLLVLDLEGGELAALRSLDFQRIHFDVLCVETNRFNNALDLYIDQVVDFIMENGYKVFLRTHGRNSWFVSPNFKIPTKN